MRKGLRPSGPDPHLDANLMTIGPWPGSDQKLGQAVLAL